MAELVAAGLAFAVANTLLASLRSPEIRGLFSLWGYKSKLEDLESTVETIKSVLLSADSMQAQGLQLSPQQCNYIDKLKDVVYEADDLIDEFITTVALQQQHQSPGKVRNFISKLKELGFGIKMSCKVKSIRKKLDQVADDANKFAFKIDDLPIRKRREETSYKVNVKDIVGRDDDLRKIVDILLGHPYNTNQEEDVYVLSIVGMGGLGKTALAQLVYNDPTIEIKFPLRLWVCVSDQYQDPFDIKSILINILKSNGEEDIDNLNLVQLANKLKETLDKSKYLLVLDDVWTENRNAWLNFKVYLSGLCQTGNKIVVTTRSEGTSKAIGSNHTHMLQGLLDVYSWALFKLMVGSQQANLPDFEQIGRDIVKKCANVPLAIRVVGSLLYGQERNIWLSFQKSIFSKIRQDKNDIMSILEFSYHHLSPSLKSCFTYCALFPKDFVFDKEKLLDLWMAQDYVKPLDEGQNIEDAAEEYFQILSRRCFFQDIVEKYDESVNFKIHDLMNDMSQQVAGNVISIANSTTSTPDEKNRHLYDDAPHSRTHAFIVKTMIRTYVMKCNRFGDHPLSQFPVSELLANWMSIRTLDLSHIGLTSLPNTIGQLLHLRYLDLSYNNGLTKLPKSLTKLITLQFLDLRGCGKFKELPEELSKLVNLRTLYVPYYLEYMSLGMARMTRLTRLNCFVVGGNKSCLKLEELRALRNLKGYLDIIFYGKYQHGEEYCGKGEYVRNTEHLNDIRIIWRTQLNDNDEGLLEDLQPHTNLKELTIRDYHGVRMGGWAREDSLTTSLPNLVRIHLHRCKGLEELPWLGRLQHLKTLNLWGLKNVEYMENRRSGFGSSSNDGASNSSTTLELSTILFFPSLETLWLSGMPKLKGWWRWMSNSTSGSAPAQILPSFHRLSSLTIIACRSLTSFPLCPSVENMELLNIGGIEIELEERYKHAI